MLLLLKDYRDKDKFFVGKWINDVNWEKLIVESVSNEVYINYFRMYRIIRVED